MVSVSDEGVLEIYHGDVLVNSCALKGQILNVDNSLVKCVVDGDPCVAVGMFGEGSGVYIYHAFSGALKRSLPTAEGVYCVRLAPSGTVVMFGTASGVLLRCSTVLFKIHCGIVMA